MMRAYPPSAAAAAATAAGAVAAAANDRCRCAATGMAVLRCDLPVGSEPLGGSMPFDSIRVL